jgi:hypothetical protein
LVMSKITPPLDAPFWAQWLVGGADRLTRPERPHARPFRRFAAAILCSAAED